MYKNVKNHFSERFYILIFYLNNFMLLCFTFRIILLSISLAKVYKKAKDLVLDCAHTALGK